MMPKIHLLFALLCTPMYAALAQSEQPGVEDEASVSIKAFVVQVNAKNDSSGIAPTPELADAPTTATIKSAEMAQNATLPPSEATSVSTAAAKNEPDTSPSTPAVSVTSTATQTSERTPEVVAASDHQEIGATLKTEELSTTRAPDVLTTPQLIVDTAALLQGTLTRSAPRINHPISVESMENLSNEIHDGEREMSKNTKEASIDDFFPPSKMELVIQHSNEKILRDKGALQMDLEPIIAGNKRDLLVEDRNKSSLATTNIEIELIEDPSETTMKTPLDLTEKLQENDEVIRHIEESFQIDDMDLRPDIVFEPASSTPVPPPTSTKAVPKGKKKAHASEFIPRRVKKMDPSTKISVLDRATLKKIDFANTKFKSHADDMKHAELSTTKFYNSKEMEKETGKKATEINKKPLLKSAAKSKVDTIATTTTNTIATPTVTTVLAAAGDVVVVITETEQPAAPSSTTGPTESPHIVEITTSTNKPSVAVPLFRNQIVRPRILTRLEEKINQLECELSTLPTDASLWRGNETHELVFPVMKTPECTPESDAGCLPTIFSWEGTADIQSGDVLLVEIDDSKLIAAANPTQNQNNGGTSANLESQMGDNVQQHRSMPSAAVYQVTRPGHEHCDITEGELLDITPLMVDGKKFITLYDKDLTEGVNFLIVVSDFWGQQCIRLKVIVKSDNCGEGADCSGKGICYSNKSMEGYECQCCTGFSGSHCEEIDACTPSPCTNNGICVDLSQGHEGHSYQCLCPYGYTGKNCQFEMDPCNPSQCMNGGTCVGNSTHFRCECIPGYTGPLCQHNLNECESSPCVHGICVDQEDGFRCFCQPGYAGELCNYEYNECESNPCLNGGQCIDHISGFSCKCTAGYTGKRCHVKVDFCANDPCPDGHRCIDHGDDFSCECPGGRNGPDCNQVPRTLCNVNPCANGGTCWTTEESFYCACRPGFTGKMCQDNFVIESVVNTNELLSDLTPNAHIGLENADMMPDPFEMHSAYIAVGTLAVAICIVAIVVTVCHCKVHQTYRHFTPKKLIPIHFGRRVAGVSAGVDHHWLKGKAAGVQNDPGNSYCTNNLHINSSAFTNNDRISRPLPPINLDSEMYYTVDFSDSQNSPLIQ